MACRTVSRDLVDDEKIDGVHETPDDSNPGSSVGWSWSDDPANPRNFSHTRKWAITSAALLATLLIPMNGTSITAGTPQIISAFNVSDKPFPNSYWTVFSWTLGGATFSVAGMSIMEDVGVRRSFMVLYGFFILMIVPQVSFVLVDA
jgi:hypothetical protein